MIDVPPNAFENPLPGVPLVESPFFGEIFTSDRFDVETLRIATELHEKGYAVVDFPEPDFDALAADVRAQLHEQFAWEEWRTRGPKREISLRIQDAWKTVPSVRRIAANETVIELLSALYGRRARPFQTLCFPTGTQQHFHSDAVHFSSHPERFMCGVWVALEDIHEDAGPLYYYPGSHRWPIYTNEQLGRCAVEIGVGTTQTVFEPLWRKLVSVHGVDRERFLAKKGQALIWAANLLHGGEEQRDMERTRWSQVTHYFFDDCLYYTPMNSDPFYGSVDYRAPVDITTGEVMEHRYVGRPINPELVETLRWRPPELPEGFDRELYLEANPDVARSGMDPEEHWWLYGVHEGRKLKP